MLTQSVRKFKEKFIQGSVNLSVLLGERKAVNVETKKARIKRDN